MESEDRGSGAATAPPGIVPRWEWRTFGADFGSADDGLGALEPERVDESDETYLLSLRADPSVKVRAGLMDVKQLQRVDDDGLEQWLPVMKAGFPLAPAQVAKLAAALGVDAPAPAREGCT